LIDFFFDGVGRTMQNVLTMVSPPDLISYLLGAIIMLVGIVLPLGVMVAKNNRGVWKNV
jgi:hypothetical protein